MTDQSTYTVAEFCESASAARWSTSFGRKAKARVTTKSVQSDASATTHVLNGVSSWKRPPPPTEAPHDCPPNHLHRHRARHVAALKIEREALMSTAKPKDKDKPSFDYQPPTEAELRERHLQQLEIVTDWKESIQRRHSVFCCAPSLSAVSIKRSLTSCNKTKSAWCAALKL